MNFRIRYFIYYFLLSGIFLKSQVVYKLDPITVSATRIPTLENESGKSITIINSDEINNLPINSIDELFRYIGGVNVNSRNDFGVQVDVGIRGSTFSQVLFLIDNISLNDPLTGHFNANIPLPISEIESVEIIRGPASASYGSNAVGGVIHIKTKSYTLGKNIGSSKFKSSVQIGQNNLKTIDVGFSKPYKKFFFSGSSRLSSSDGEVYNNPNYLIGTSNNSTYNTNFSILTNTFSLAYFLNSKMKFYFRLGNDKRDFNAKYFYTTSPYDESFEKISSFWIQSGLKIDYGKNILEFNFGNKILKDTFIFNPLFSTNNHRTNKSTYLVSYYIPFSNKLEIAVGGQYVFKNIQSSDRGNHWNESKGLFGVLNIKLLKNINQSLSLRIENDNYINEIIPLFQYNLSYNKSNLVFRSSIGMAFRSPDFTERYISSQIDSLSPGRNFGNPNLKSEKSISYEVGVDYSAKNNLKINSSIFYRESNDLIDYTITNSSAISNNSNLYYDENYFYSKNIFFSHLIGMEVILRKKIIFNNTTFFNLTSNYTQLKTASSENDLSKYLSNHPTQNFSLNLLFNYKFFSFSHLINYVERKEELNESINSKIPRNYLVNNIKISFLMNKRLSFYFKITNLNNMIYQDILGAPLPGRWASIGITHLN